MKLYLILYNIFFVPILVFVSKILGLVSPKMQSRKKNIKSSLNNLEKLDKYKNTIWIHTASMGEFEQAKPIIEKLKLSQNNKNIQIVCTFFSASGYNTQKKYIYADAICYLPLDTPSNSKKFINKINPKIVVFIRYELWLNYLKELKKQKIPTLLVNATFPISAKKYSFLKNFYTYLFNLFSKIYTTSAEQTLLFNSNLFNNNLFNNNLFNNNLFNNNLFNNNLFNNKLFNNKLSNNKLLDKDKEKKTIEIITATDTRIERIIQKVNEAKSSPILPRSYFKNNDENCKIIVAGSTWDIDENYLINASQKLNKLYKNRIKLILVPHEPTEAHIKKLKTKAHNIILLSEILANLHINSADSRNIIVVDSIGNLLKLYGTADAAYIGGAFGAGVHSLTEPAGYGIPICTGKNCYNSADAKFLENIGALTVANNQEDIFNWMQKILTDEDFVFNAGNAAAEYIANNSGTTAKIVEEILFFLDSERIS